MFDNIYFGIILTLSTYIFGYYLNNKYRNPILSPLLVSIILSIMALIILDVEYESYMQGGAMISFFVGPATVAMVVPLYKQRALLKEYKLAIIVGIIAGSFTALSSVLLLGKLFNIDKKLLISLMPKSITTAIGLKLSEEYNGLVSITSFAIVFTGLAGSILGPSLLKLFKIENPISVGVAMGTSAHAMGTSKALEMGNKEGAIASLCIGIAGIVTVIMFPIFIYLI